MKKKQTDMSFKQRFIITLVATLAVALVHNYANSVESEAAPAPATVPVVQTASR